MEGQLELVSLNKGDRVKFKDGTILRGTFVVWDVYEDGRAVLVDPEEVGMTTFRTTKIENLTIL